MSLENATYGFEFEFSNPLILKNWNPKKGLIPGYDDAYFDGREPFDAMRMAHVVAQLCAQSKDCQVKEESYKYFRNEFRVVFADGYWIRISFDPACVEIQGKPLTKKEYRDKSELLEKYVFEAAKKAGLVLDRKEGMGHFNIGAQSAFGRDEVNGLRFLSYFVDFQNHPELSMGAIGKDVGGNSPTLTVLHPSQSAALQALVTGVVKRKYKLSAVAAYINRYVYTHTLDNLSAQNNQLDRRESQHNQAITVEDFEKFSRKQFADKIDLPMEIRPIFAQESIEQFILQIELFELRNNFLAGRGYPLKFLNLKKNRFSKSELVSRFYVYVTEAGGDFEHFKPLLHKSLRNIAPDKFVLTGHLDLKRSEDLKLAKLHAPYIATSSWVRERFLKLFSDLESCLGLLSSSH